MPARAAPPARTSSGPAGADPPHNKRLRSGPLLRRRVRVVVNLRRKQAHHHVFPFQSRPSCAIMRTSRRPGLGCKARAPGCGGRALGYSRGAVSRLRLATPPRAAGTGVSECGSRHVVPVVAELTSACGMCQSLKLRRGAGVVRVLRLTRTPPRLLAPGRETAPRVVVPPGGTAAPRVPAAPPGGARLVLADPHRPAPDVSGPCWSRPWGRLLIPDQKARRQRTGRSYTPLELAPAQAAPDRPRPWKPMPRTWAGRHPPAPKAGAVNLRGLTVHRPR